MKLIYFEVIDKKRKWNSRYKEQKDNEANKTAAYAAIAAVHYSITTSFYRKERKRREFKIQICPCSLLKNWVKLCFQKMLARVLKTSMKHKPGSWGQYGSIT